MLNTQCREFNPNKDSVDDLDALRYLKHLENIVELESKPLPSALLWTETYAGTNAGLSEYIAEPW
jgi:hypothetical protein